MRVNEKCVKWKIARSKNFVPRMDVCTEELKIYARDEKPFFQNAGFLMNI
jgi:hypothetical protein